MAVLTTRRVRRLGLIGDIHAQLHLLERAADALATRDVDVIACVGDIYGPGTDTTGCCRLLNERRILTVRGNHDRWFLEAAALDVGLRTSVGLDAIMFLSGLPVTLEIETEAGTALLCHGVGANDLAHLPRTFPRSFVRRSMRVGHISPRIRCVLHGHTHAHRQLISEDILFVTAGALRSHPEAGSVIVDTDTRTATTIPY